jgi:hypothetical protein
MMSHPPSLFTLTAASGSECTGSTPALGRCGGLLLAICCFIGLLRGDPVGGRGRGSGGDDGINIMEVRWEAPMWTDETDGR